MLVALHYLRRDDVRYDLFDRQRSLRAKSHDYNHRMLNAVAIDIGSIDRDENREGDDSKMRIVCPSCRAKTVTDRLVGRRGIPDWAGDQIRNRTTCHFSFMDRLRILFGMTVEVSIRLNVEHAPGKMETLSDVYVDRWIPSKPCAVMEHSMIAEESK